jgi:outer membrane lipoprotein-sorting protein
MADNKNDVSVDTLFDRMEKRTETITSLEVDVVLKNSLHHKNCRLTIMSPDKFAIEFDDSSIEAFFNGKKLWLKIEEIKEVFYHFSDSGSVFLRYIPIFNPKKIFTNLTRRTLSTLFKVELVTSEKTPDQKYTLYTLKFTPKMKSIFKQVFSVGHYHMIFSNKDYLPVRVLEFDPKGNERGRLDVVEYRLNVKLPEKRFEFVPPPGYNLIPISVIFAQKLEECGKLFINRIGEAAKNMKNSILDWSF